MREALSSASAPLSRIATRFALGLYLCLAPLRLPGGEAGDPFIPDADWQKAPAAEVTRGGEADLGGSAGKMLAGLLAVLGLVALAAFAVRRLGLHRRVRTGRHGHLELIETVSLGGKRGLSLVGLDDQVFLVGHAEQQVSHLATIARHRLEEPPAEAQGDAAAPRDDHDDHDEAPAVSDFKERLRRALGRSA